MRNDTIDPELLESNPWWRDPDGWQDRDVQLRTAMWSPLNYTPRPLDDLQSGGLYILRGPRRVGKSTASFPAVPRTARGPAITAIRTGQRARERLLAEHTPAHRAESLEEYMQEVGSREFASPVRRLQITQQALLPCPAGGAARPARMPIERRNLTVGAKMTVPIAAFCKLLERLSSPDVDRCRRIELPRNVPVLLFLCLALLLPNVLGACARIGGESSSSESGFSTLTVMNRGWQDATIYSVRGTTRIRFGLVAGLSNRDFAIPSDALEGGHTLVLFADPVGGFEGYRSPAITVTEGDRVELWLQPTLAQSSVLVR